MKERFFPVRLDSNAARGRKREAQRIQRTWLLMMRAERTDALSAIRKRCIISEIIASCVVARGGARRNGDRSAARRGAARRHVSLIDTFRTIIPIPWPLKYPALCHSASPVTDCASRNGSSSTAVVVSIAFARRQLARPTRGGGWYRSRPQLGWRIPFYRVISIPRDACRGESPRDRDRRIGCIWSSRSALLVNSRRGAARAGGERGNGGGGTGGGG
jgi:hypothetical protein